MDPLLDTRVIMLNLGTPTGWVPGRYGSASANFGSLSDVSSFSSSFLNNSYVGVRDVSANCVDNFDF
jgi:hypothetical protein